MHPPHSSTYLSPSQTTKRREIARNKSREEWLPYCAFLSSFCLCSHWNFIGLRWVNFFFLVWKLIFFEIVTLMWLDMMMIKRKIKGAEVKLEVRESNSNYFSPALQVESSNLFLYFYFLKVFEKFLKAVPTIFLRHYRWSLQFCWRPLYLYSS